MPDHPSSPSRPRRFDYVKGAFLVIAPLTGCSTPPVTTDAADDVADTATGLDTVDAVDIAVIDAGADAADASLDALVDRWLDEAADAAGDVRPADATDVQPGATCDTEEAWCSPTLRCRSQAICIVPTPCCGGCSCTAEMCSSTGTCSAGAVCQGQPGGVRLCVQPDGG